MASTADNLRAMQPEITWRAVAVMTTVGDGTDPTTIVVSDGSAEFICAAIDGYRLRTPGDQVIVGQLPGGTWVCLGKLGAVGIDAPSRSEVAAMISDGITANTPGTITVKFGSSAPIGLIPYTKVVDTYVRDDGNGDTSIVFVAPSLATHSTRNDGPSPPPVTIPAAAGSSWRDDGTILGETVQAGPENASASPWSGAWYFGSAIAAAIAGRTVSKIWLRVARTEGYGSDGSVLVHFGLHNQPGPGPIPTLTDQWTPSRSGVTNAGTGKVPAGGTVQFEIPSTQRINLVTGAAFGVGVWATNPRDLCRFDSAELVIQFAA